MRRNDRPYCMTSMRRRRWSGIFMIGAIVLWLVPFFIAGANWHRPQLLDKITNFQHSAAALFTKRPTSWWQHVIQVQRAGEAQWTTVAASDLSTMSAFGYRTRIDRMLLEVGDKPVAENVKRRLAAWVAHRLGELYPSARKVTMVRYVRTVWPVGTRELAQPAGAWSIPPVELLADRQVRIKGIYRINRDGATKVPEGEEIKGTQARPALATTAPGKIPKRTFAPTPTGPDSLLARNLPPADTVRALIQSQPAAHAPPNRALPAIGRTRATLSPVPGASPSASTSTVPGPRVNPAPLSPVRTSPALDLPLASPATVPAGGASLPAPPGAAPANIPSTGGSPRH